MMSVRGSQCKDYVEDIIFVLRFFVKDKEKKYGNIR